MKIKYAAVLLITAIFIAVWPLEALASEVETSKPIFDSTVKCVVPSIYDFSILEAVEINYPNTSSTIGEFIVGDLLLKSGETLSVQLSLGKMSNNNGDMLIYNVVSAVPEKIDSSQSGLAYDIALSIDSDEFRDANPGTYNAPLLFQVFSSIYDEAVWNQIVYIKAIKNDTGQSNPSNSAYTVLDVKENIIEAEKSDEQYIESKRIEPAIIAIEDENNASSEEIIIDEKVPLGPTNLADTKPHWIFVMCCGIVLFILSCFFIIRHENDKNEEK